MNSEFRDELAAERRRLERELGLEHEDDTAGRTEPETVDVWAEQAPPADWAREPRNDFQLARRVRERLGLKW